VLLVSADLLKIIAAGIKQRIAILLLGHRGPIDLAGVRRGGFKIVGYLFPHRLGILAPVRDRLLDLLFVPRDRLLTFGNRLCDRPLMLADLGFRRFPMLSNPLMALA
jgi:hypothetical protein